MIKKLMVVFFCAFAALIVLSVALLSGKMVLMPSSDEKTVYEIRLHEGTLQHALRHGGVQLFSWSDIVLKDENGNAFPLKDFYISRNNSKTGEFEITGFLGETRLLVRVTNSFVATAFYGLPAGKTVERVDIRPEPGALGTRFNDAALAGLDENRVARPFIFIAPKADGGDTFLVYQHTESTKNARPKFIYDAESLAPANFNARTIYDENVKDGWLHVLYFSDSPVLLREIYEAGIPSEPFPTFAPQGGDEV